MASSIRAVFKWSTICFKIVWSEKDCVHSEKVLHEHHKTFLERSRYSLLLFGSGHMQTKRFLVCSCDCGFHLGSSVSSRVPSCLVDWSINCANLNLCSAIVLCNGLESHPGCIPASSVLRVSSWIQRNPDQHLQKMNEHMNVKACCFVLMFYHHIY